MLYALLLMGLMPLMLPLGDGDEDDADEEDEDLEDDEDPGTLDEDPPPMDYDVPADSGTVTLADFREGVDSVTLHVGPDDEITIEGGSDVSCEIRVSGEEGDTSLIFRGLDRLPIDDIQISVSDAETGEETVFALCDVIAGAGAGGALEPVLDDDPDDGTGEVPEPGLSPVVDDDGDGGPSDPADPGTGDPLTPVIDDDAADSEPQWIEIGGNGEWAEIHDFVPGRDVLSISLDGAHPDDMPEITIRSGEDGSTSEVLLDDALVAVVDTPDLTLADIHLELHALAA